MWKVGSIYSINTPCSGAVMCPDLLILVLYKSFTYLLTYFLMNRPFPSAFYCCARWDGCLTCCWTMLNGLYTLSTPYRHQLWMYWDNASPNILPGKCTHSEIFVNVAVLMYRVLHGTVPPYWALSFTCRWHATPTCPHPLNRSKFLSGRRSCLSYYWSLSVEQST